MFSNHDPFAEATDVTPEQEPAPMPTAAPKREGFVPADPYPAGGNTRADELLRGLNPEQAEAVQHTEGPLLILAGAGTGKTRVLTHRIAYLLLTQAARTNEILAVTFTNKAAREMAERTEQLIGGAPTGMWLGTFHRLGMRMLRSHAERAGLKPDFVILDPDDQQRLITQLVKDAGLDPQRYVPRQLGFLFNKWLDNGWHADDVSTEEASAFDRHGVKLFRQYQARLKALNAVDFGHLLLHPLTILRQNPDLLERYQRQLRYIMVDEYQDTNAVQYQWLKLLAQHNNIAVVGDDDQSIYAWRGALVGNILKFDNDYPNAHVVRLEQNYRSTGHILAAANGVISNNKTRHDKALWTDAGNGERIEVHPLMDDREEARFVADQCAAHLRTGKSPNDLAVLVRTAAQTRPLEEAFIRAGITYVVVGGLRFYERKEIKDALAYLRLVQNASDDLAFERIVNVPRRGVGEGTLQQLRDQSVAEGYGLLEAARALIDADALGGKAGGQLRMFVEQVDNWKVLAQVDTPDRLTERILTESGYLDMLQADDEPDAKARIDNLKELLRALQEYPDLQSFLDHVSLVADGDAETGDAVRLMTIHAAKGLEFHTVFLPGFEEGLFPHQRSMNEEGQKGLEEERRLAYVALTRARTRLVISYTAGRRMWGQFIPGIESRFLKEIPEEHLKKFASTAPGFMTGGYGSGNYMGGPRPMPGSTADRRSSQYGGSDYRKPAEPLIDYSTESSAYENGPGPVYRTQAKSPWREGARKIVNEAIDAEFDQSEEHVGFKVGQRVFHQKFGYGRIMGTEGNGAELKLHVAFDKSGVKKMLATLANLTAA
ncbi:MAG TPA: UvrD-helicase domain-containing protein [Alphaproteobacteria bacterium]|nr:UvrD-helicase domain-containing protein [Alphaproteobacteria bacterium]